MKILETLGTIVTGSAVLLDLLTAKQVVVGDHSFAPRFASSCLQ